MLALPNSRLTSAGERQSALRKCRYHASVGSRASAYADLPAQNSRKVDSAITRTSHYSPNLGLRQGVLGACCLQPHVDAKTGEKSYVFSCFNQDQPLDQVDFPALAQRLAQNGVQEKLTALWIGRCLKLLPPPAERKAA